MCETSPWRTALGVGLVALCAMRASAASFRFTATADSRSSRSNFQHCLSQVNVQCGDEGVFHISPGDIDPLPDNFNDLVSAFGSNVVWYPGVGNHESETAADMTWIRSRYAALPYIVNTGPAGCGTTTYSFDYETAHFVGLNQYYDGTSDIGTTGDTVDALYNWLVADLAATTKPVKFVFGHEPAFPFNRHVGDSLDQYPARRDRFWALLESENVAAFICGHTHYYSRYQHGGGNVWQIDLGNAGNDPGDGQTFLDCTVDGTQVRFDIWRGTNGQTFALHHSWTENFDGGTTNEPPTVSITGPADGASFGAPADVAVTAVASDSDGSVSKVDLYRDGAFVATDSSEPYEWTLTGLGVGSHTLTATATDDEGATATSAAVTITVQAIQPVSVPFRMNCGVNSYTPSGWAEDDGYVTGGADYDNWPNAISTAGVANAAPGSVYETVRHVGPHTYTIPIADGSYVVRLHSCEGYSATSTRDVKYVIEGVTVADHMDYATEAGGYFKAMVKDFDVTVADGDIVIECTDYSSTDVFEAGMEVLEGGGPSNQPPTVSIASPADGASFTAPADIVVTADASDADGSVAKVDLYVNGAFDRTDDLAPYEWTLTGLAEGSYTLAAEATDDYGATATSVAVTVTVQLDPTLDTDGDGMTDVFEIEKGFDRNNGDQDGNDVLDGLDDWDGDGVDNQDDTTPGRPPSSGESTSFGCVPTGVEGAAFLAMLLAFAPFARRRARSRPETGRT